jgi:hypothetical protein
MGLSGSFRVLSKTVLSNSETCFAMLSFRRCIASGRRALCAAGRHVVVAAARPYSYRKLRFGKASAFWRAMCRWLSAEDDPEELLDLSAHPTWC